MPDRPRLPDGQSFLQEVAKTINGYPSDSCFGTCVVLRAYADQLSHSLNDGNRQLMLPLIPLLVDTYSDKLELRRLKLLIDASAEIVGEDHPKIKKARANASWPFRIRVSNAAYEAVEALGSDQQHLLGCIDVFKKAAAIRS